MATARQWKPVRIGVVQLLNLLRLAGEAAWLYPWSLALGAWLVRTSQPLLGLPTLFAVLLLAAVGTQAAVRAQGHPKLARGAFIGLGALTTCLVAVSQFPVLSVGGDWAVRWELLSRQGYGGRAAIDGAIAVFLWWRGITVGRSQPSSWNVEDEFRTGIIAMAGLLVIVALAGKNAGVTPDTLVLSVLLLIFTGLVGMPLARVLDESERPHHADSPRLSPGGPWLTMLLGVVVVVLLATMILAQLFTFQRLDALFGPLLGPLDALLWALIFLMALPFGLLASVAIYAWRLLVRPGGTPAQLQPPDMGWLNDLQRQSQGGAGAPELLLALKVGLTILLALIILAILVQAVRRFSDWWDNDEVEEERGFLSSRPGLQELLRWLLHRLRPPRTRILDGVGGLAATEAAGDGIRGVYREFLWLGAAMGHGRKPAETPREYQGKLRKDRLPGAAEIDLITEIYHLARYAPPVSGDPDIAPVAAALARLRALWDGWSRS